MGKRLACACARAKRECVGSGWGKRGGVRGGRRWVSGWRMRWECARGSVHVGVVEGRDGESERDARDGKEGKGQRGMVRRIRGERSVWSWDAYVVHVHPGHDVSVPLDDCDGLLCKLG